MEKKPSIVVISAHAADFIWRAGGAIALYADRGYRVRVICLSFGERGESARLWKQPDMSVEIDDVASLRPINTWTTTTGTFPAPA